MFLVKFLRTFQNPHLLRLVKAKPVVIFFSFLCLSYTGLFLFAGNQLQESKLSYVAGGWDDSNPVFKFSDYRQSLNKSITEFWSSIHLGFVCPQNLLSIVGFSQSQLVDNSKYVCGLKNLAKFSTAVNELETPAQLPRCLIYSFTTRGDALFEEEILRKTNCSVFLYDPHPQLWPTGLPLEEYRHSRFQFKRLTIGVVNRGYHKSLKMLLSLNSHNYIDIVKIDTNFGGYHVLDRILKDFRQLSPWPIGQLIVKFNTSDWSPAGRTYWLVNLLESLEQRGLRLFHIKVNSQTRGDYWTDASFINVNSLQKFMSKEDISPSLSVVD